MKAQMNLLNALEMELFLCGTTRLTQQTHASFFARTHSAPFVLVTQITEGALHVHFEDATYTVEPGQALIVPAHTKYTLQLAGEAAVSHWLNMNYKLYGHFSVFDFIEVPSVASAEVGERVGRIQAEIVDLMQCSYDVNCTSLRSAAKVKQLSFAILEIVLTISRYKPGSIENMSAIKRFNPVFHYIEEHIADKIKVSQLAELMYVSTSHFHKEFQEAFDFSPMQFIQTQRFKKAQYLLATTTSTIREIAGLVGYDNAFTFIRFFKSMYGTSPGNYRKMITQGLNQ